MWGDVIIHIYICSIMVIKPVRMRRRVTIPIVYTLHMLVITYYLLPGIINSPFNVVF